MEFKPEHIVSLLQHKMRIEHQVIDINFKIGRYVYERCLKEGETAVAEMAAAFNRQKMPISEDFLFETRRVYRALQSPKLLNYIKRQVGHYRFTWPFLAHKCTKAPAGNSIEAMRYWERELFKVEATLEKIEDAYVNGKQLPEPLKEQTEGLLSTFVPQPTK